MPNNHGGHRTGAGAKTYKEQGLEKNKIIKVGLPPHLHARLMRAFEGYTFSEYVAEIIEAGLNYMERSV